MNKRVKRTLTGTFIGLTILALGIWIAFLAYQGLEAADKLSSIVSGVATVVFGATSLWLGTRSDPPKTQEAVTQERPQRPLIGKVSKARNVFVAHDMRFDQRRYQGAEKGPDGGRQSSDK